MEPEEKLTELLKEAGAVAFGMVEATPVDDSEWFFFTDWLKKGYHAGMAYMERYPDIRRDPRLLLEQGARTIVSIAFNYRQPNPIKGIATYALGEDYHKVLRRRLKPVIKKMGDEFGGHWRICIDSAPLLERYWACKCGIGTRSPFHGNVVVPGVGSMVFLCEIITTLPLKNATVSFVDSAECGEGIDINPEGKCPTGALMANGTIDSRLCINYLTIEHKDELDDIQRKLLGNAFFGCDVCQRICKENQGRYQEILEDFSPMKGLDEFVKGIASDFDIKNSPLSRKFMKKLS